MTAYRKEKLEEQIRRLISELIIQGDVKDPRLGFVSISSVKLSSDKKSVKVGISVLGEPRERFRSLEGLRSAASFIQFRIGKAMQLRYTPHLEFYLDSSVSDGVEMVNLIDSLPDVRERSSDGDSSDPEDTTE
jgi:ribosome-binding factor A